MIVATLENISHQALITPNLEKALAYLRSPLSQDPTEGRIEIDGSYVFALVQSYITKPEISNPQFEAHRKYIDLQCVVSGRELFGWTLLDNLKTTNPYNSEKDIIYGSVPQEQIAFVPITSGHFILVYPWDAHAPGLAVGSPASVKKIVIKIALHSNL